MPDLLLVNVCLTTFGVVFGVLAALAAVMHVITVIFPMRSAKGDPALVAAISSSVTSLFPNSRVTRIEEEL